MQTNANPEALRTIRSFVRRAGRMTPAQGRALTTFGPQFTVPFQPQIFDFDGHYPSSLEATPCVFEIGFGMGEATAQIAQAHPQTRFLCCEVHPPGVGALLRRIDALGLCNIRIIAHDAVEVLHTMLPPSGLDGLHIFFPDPWPKKRHHKRRLIQPGLVHELARRLKPGAYLHLATDWAEYAQHMLAVLQAEPLLCNTSDHPQGWSRHQHLRPQTKFERRGLRLGHGVYDLIFRRR